MVVDAVHDEAEFRLDRAAREHAHSAGNVVALLTERFKDAGDRGLPDQLVYDDPDGAVPVVLDDQNDRALEMRVTHRRRGDQQLAGQ
jgi:hypothetical protein